MKHPMLDHFATQLTRVVEDGGSDNRLVVTAGPVWLVFRGHRGGQQLALEAAPNRLLPRDARPAVEKISALRAAGFASRSAAAGLVREIDLAAGWAARDLGAACVELFHRVYGMPADTPWDLHLSLGERRSTRNPELLDAMRALSKTRSQDDRVALYRALLRARLLLRVDAEGAALVTEREGRWCNFTVFSDMDSADRHDPRPLALQEVVGVLLFRNIFGPNVASLSINPSGPVGGVLLRGELEAMARAANRSVSVRSPNALS